MIILLSVMLSNDFINFVVDAKNNGPLTLYTPFSCVTVTREIFATKRSALKITPMTTPIAKFCVYKIIPTVTSMTSVSDRGACFINVNEPQLNVVIATKIMTPTRTGIGISMTTSPKTMIKNMRNTPAVNVDRRPRPPDLTLITDCPINAQPAIPPKKPVMKLAIPCPRASLFLLLGVFVISSNTWDVSSDSNKPTIERANEYGKITFSVSKLSGISRSEERRVGKETRQHEQ